MAARKQTSQRRSRRSNSAKGSSSKTTKTSSRRGASSGSSRSRSTKAGASKARSTGRSSGGSSARRSASSQRKQPSAARSGNGQSTVESVTGTVSSGAQNAGQGVATVVKKMKTPLIAGSAAVVGLAGAVALNSVRSRRRKVLGVSLPSGNGLKRIDARKIAGTVTDAAKRADRFGQRVSSVASSVQMVSETADKAAKKT
jgi:hypothetical protein